MSERKYFQKHIDFIAKNIKGRPYKELTEMFNKEFGLNVSVGAVIKVAFLNKLKNEINTRFTKGRKPTYFRTGHTPWNKGLKGAYASNSLTKFKKGNKPHNYRSIGSERINFDGYVEIKVADPRKWKLKHRIIWEEAHGKIPKDHIILFADQNKLNVSLDNLMLVSKREVLIMNRRKLIFDDPELTKVGKLNANVHSKIYERVNK